MYHRTPRVPQDADLALARVFADTAALAIERHHIEQAKLAAEASATVGPRRAGQGGPARSANCAPRPSSAPPPPPNSPPGCAPPRPRRPPAPHPEHCQLGGRAGCTAPAEIKIADSWGDAAWGCPAHVEEAIINVRSVFIASEELGGLAAYLNR